jgi:dienelactone hydrolase
LTLIPQSAVLLRMQISRTLLLPVFLVAVLIVCASAQESAPIVAAPAAAQAAGDVPVRFVQKEMWVHMPGAFPNGLDALEVYVDLPGRHPLVVLTHGTADKPEDRAHVTPWAQIGQALWFARRGYVAFVVVRRGYGRSGGQQDSTNGGCGNRGSFEETGEASAEDLRAVMSFAQGLPEVDPDAVLSAGVSTGGFAQLALAANPPKGLKAAISFAGGRGGDGHEHNCNLPGVLDAFRAFGKGAHKHGDLPMLWIYSQNDHWFTPAMAQQFDEAYKKGGGVNQFVMAPPDGDDGHHLYMHVSAWSDTVTAFLKAQNLLPLGDKVMLAPLPPNVPMPAALGDADKDTWRRFLLAPPYKTLAANESGQLSISAAAFDQSLADSEAMDRCRKANGGGKRCSIVARTPGEK